MYLFKLTQIYKRASIVSILLKGCILMKILNFFANFFGGGKIKVDKSRKVLFVLKQRQNYDEQKEKVVQHFAKSMVTGMFNSVTFISNMLNEVGIVSKVVIVIDNNSIDREVSLFKPTDVFIEGMWVVSEKFDVLKKLHPTVNWVVRCHSEIPFLSGEGNAIERMFGYANRNIAISGNSFRIGHTFRDLLKDALKLNNNQIEKLSPILPNYYPIVDKTKYKCPNKPTKTLNVGCFGAIRPLKNQLIQAIAAVEFAKNNKKKLNFHINVGRVEGNALGQIKNIRSLFDNLGEDFNLVEHAWVEHEDFCNLLEEMDICMQVSFSETFNIVVADAVSRYVPVVVSSEISWVNSECFADTTDVNNIVSTMQKVLDKKQQLIKANVKSLNKFSENSKLIWMKYFSK